MPLPPYPIAPAPRTWSAEDLIATYYLDADPANAALLLANRPFFVGIQSATGQTLPASTVTPVELDAELSDAWNGHQIPTANWDVPLAGIYLCEGDMQCNPFSANTSALIAGIQSSAGGTVTSNSGGEVVANGVSVVETACADLVQLNPATTDYVALYGDPVGQAAVIEVAGGAAKLKAEWVGLPATGPTAGTVITSPQLAAQFPSGSGTVITNSGGIAAGATSITVANPTGMVVGGTLGLDWFLGQMTAPVAETVSITSVAGSTIGISATLYPHLVNAPVAVPVSAPFLNQQVRDAIRFLAYPPMANLDTSGTSATLPTQTFPAGTPITFLRDNIDNFSGWNGTTSWVVPVSGVYYLYGQVYVSSASGYSLCAGLRQNSGTVMWGTVNTNQSATARSMCSTVRRQVRLSAGDTIQLYGSQNSGASLSIFGSGAAYSKLIAVFRSF